MNETELSPKAIGLLATPFLSLIALCFFKGIFLNHPSLFHFLPLAPILLLLISIFLASTPLLSKNLSIAHQGGSATNQGLNKAELALPGSWTSYSAGQLLDVPLSVCLSVLLPYAMPRMSPTCSRTTDGGLYDCGPSRRCPLWEPSLAASRHQVFLLGGIIQS